MTEALYIETANEELELSEHNERRLNVSGVLRLLGVSRNGYNSWKKRLPSNAKQKKQAIKEKINLLKQAGENITEKTVGNYMREMGIKAQWIKPYTVTTIDSDFDIKLKNILTLGVQSRGT